MQLLARALARKENDRVARFARQYYGASHGYDGPPASCDEELRRYERMQPRERDPVLYGRPGWCERYRTFLLTSASRMAVANAATGNAECAMESVVGAYLRTLEWVWLYYTEGVPSWSWYYPFLHAPLLHDVARVAGRPASETFDIGAPCMPLVQLLAVLPPASFRLLPAELGRALRERSPAPDVQALLAAYPEKFREDTSLREFRWEGTPLLPFVDLALAEGVVNRVARVEAPRNALRRNALCVAAVDLGRAGKIGEPR